MILPFRWFITSISINYFNLPNNVGWINSLSYLNTQLIIRCVKRFKIIQGIFRQLRHYNMEMVYILQLAFCQGFCQWRGIFKIFFCIYNTYTMIRNMIIMNIYQFGKTIIRRSFELKITKQLLSMALEIEFVTTYVKFWTQ